MQILLDHEIAIRAKLCFPHLKNKNNENNEYKDSQTSSTSENINLIHESCMESDAVLVPEEPYLSSSDIESSLLIFETPRYLRQVHHFLKLKKESFGFK